MRRAILTALFGLSACATPVMRPLTDEEQSLYGPIIYPAGFEARVKRYGAQLLQGDTFPEIARGVPNLPPEKYAFSPHDVICEVLADVYADGRTTNVQGACSNPDFAGVAEEAMQTVRFVAVATDKTDAFRPVLAVITYHGEAQP